MTDFGTKSLFEFSKTLLEHFARSETEAMSMESKLLQLEAYGEKFDLWTRNLPMALSDAAAWFL
jgi:hypothetical protein